MTHSDGHMTTSAATLGIEDHSFEPQRRFSERRSFHGYRVVRKIRLRFTALLEHAATVRQTVILVCTRDIGSRSAKCTKMGYIWYQRCSTDDKTEHTKDIQKSHRCLGSERPRKPCRDEAMLENFRVQVPLPVLIDSNRLMARD